MSSKLDTRVVQVTNVAPATTKEQLKTLFGFLGRIRDCKLFPPDLQWEMEGPGTDGVWGTTHDGSDQQVAAKVCYVEFEDSASAGVALHLTNTVFIDRALIVVPVMDGKIPDERVAMQLTPQTVARMTPGQPAWPANVVSQLSGTGATQMITTYDPRLNALGLPQYPPLPAMLDAARVEEIRRTVYIGNLDPKTTAENLIAFFSQVGEVKFVRMAGDESSRSAYMEFTDQRSVATCLTYNGVMFNGHPVTVSHAKSNISKPLTKSQEASRREIEEAMKKVKEAQSLISAAAGEKSRSRSRSRKRSRSRSRYSRSRSRSRRSRSRSRGRRRRSRSRGRRSRSPRRSSRRSRTRSPRRRRSRSRSGIVVIPAKDRPSRSKRSRTRSPKRRSRTRSPPKRRSRTPPRAYSSRRSRSRSRGRRSLSRSRHRSRSRGKDRSKDKSRDKDRSRDKDDKDAEKKREKEEKWKGSASSRSPSPPTLKREGSAAPHSGDEGSPPAKRYSSGGEPPPLKGHSEDIPDKKPTKTRDRSKSPRSPVRTMRKRSASRSPNRPIRRRSVSPIVKRRSKSRSPRRSRSPRKKKARSRSRSGSRQKAKKEKKRERSRSRDRKEKDKKKKSTKDKKEEKSSRVTRDYDEEEKGFNSGSEREPGSPSQQDGEDDNEDRRSPVGRQPDDMDMSD